MQVPARWQEDPDTLMCEDDEPEAGEEEAEEEWQADEWPEWEDGEQAEEWQAEEQAAECQAEEQAEEECQAGEQAEEWQCGEDWQDGEGWGDGQPLLYSGSLLGCVDRAAKGAAGLEPAAEHMDAPADADVFRQIDLENEVTAREIEELQAQREAASEARQSARESEAMDREAMVRHLRRELARLEKMEAEMPDDLGVLLGLHRCTGWSVGHLIALGSLLMCSFAVLRLPANGPYGAKYVDPAEVWVVDESLPPCLDGSDTQPYSPDGGVPAAVAAEIRRCEHADEEQAPQVAGGSHGLTGGAASGQKPILKRVIIPKNAHIPIKQVKVNIFEGVKTQPLGAIGYW